MVNAAQKHKNFRNSLSILIKKSFLTLQAKIARVKQLRIFEFLIKIPSTCFNSSNCAVSFNNSYFYVSRHITSS